MTFAGTRGLESLCRLQRRQRNNCSGDEFIVDTEVLFDCGDADFKLEAFVDLALLELAELGIEAFDIVFGCHLSANIRNVVFGRHVLDDETEHIAEFLERRFLGHDFEVMSL
jgi:hypothetical protein